MSKANVRIGHTTSGLDNYRTDSFEQLGGADIEVKDGLGNTIEVYAREGKIGYRIVLNGKLLAEMGEVKP